MIKKTVLLIDLPYHHFQRWLHLIGTFLLGQGTLQLIQLISGLLLFRWLSVEEYAQYSMAFAFQCTAHVLVEFGFSGTIVALVGNKIDDKKIIGNYIKAGHYYRNKLFTIISLFCLIVFPIITAKHNWPIIATLMLLVSIISNLFFTSWTSYYTPPLRIHQKVGLLYKIQVKNGLARLLALYFLYAISILNSWLAALLGSLQTLLNGYFIKESAKNYVDESGEIDIKAKQDMVSLIKPIMPGIIFSAFQGQIMVFISSIFAHTNEIAEIGALSRIGQLYAVLSMAGGVLIAPYIARLPKKGLFKIYCFIISICFAFCGFIVLFGYIYPYPFLWILGSKYDHLTYELVLLLISSGLSLVNSVMWEMNESRKWIYSWDPILMIAGTLILQITCMMIYDLNKIEDILMLTIITNSFILLLRFVVTFYGFNKEHQH